MSSSIEENTLILNLPQSKAMDDVLLERVRARSFLRFFPEKVDAFLSLCEVRTHVKGSVIVSGRSRLEFLLIPLNTAVQIKVSSDRIGFDKVIESVQANELIGFREVLEGIDFPLIAP